MKTKIHCQCFLLVAMSAMICQADQPRPFPMADFEKEIKPILTEHCFDCHGNGSEEGGVSFDDLLKSKDEPHVRETWHRILKQLRADLMPPVDELQPSEEQLARLESWIIRGPLGLDPDHPNPGKLTVRRLNRVEYQNTIRDLLGAEFDTSNTFPADDTGHGFDNISDVLSISPLLLEKYFDAAEEIITSVVPTQSRVANELKITGANFASGNEKDANVNRRGQLELSYYKDEAATAKIEIGTTGNYQLNLNLVAVESYVDNVFDLNKCEFTFIVDGEALLKREFVRQGGKNFSYDFDRELTAGEHSLVVQIKPISKEEQVRNLRVIVKSVDIIGPLAKEHFVKPDGYDRFFPRDVPDGDVAKREYARELLGKFVERAFRRPVDDDTINRLVELSASAYQNNGESFEQGVAKAMTAVLASPSFIFREEFVVPGDTSKFPLIDEYSLASRLSFFLWSSMPDEELIGLAKQGKLRTNLDAQIKRMVNDERFDNFVENFAGQWLQARAIDTVQISSRSVLRRDAKPDPEADAMRKRFFELFRKGEERTQEEEKEFKLAGEAFRKTSRRGGSRIDLNNEIRRSMRRETEMSLAHIIQDDRSLLELIESNYTFLNGPLAKYYQIEGVDGNEMRKFELPKDSVRGGVLTQGTILAVTSNPDRTSPVKRGLFVLENLLGTPTPAPPPNLPTLEDQEEENAAPVSLRESLARHRLDPKCSSCHNRMDPLGLALENFNAMGRFRIEELGLPIDSKGVLITGESFSTVSELKKILVTSRKSDYYRCATEKMLTYALGRAVEYQDIPVVDNIVEDLESNQGRSSKLLYGIINSAAFQRTGKTSESNELSHK